MQFQAQAESLNDAAANLELEWIVAEQTKVTGSAPRCDTRSYGDHAPLGAILAERIDVWGGGGLQRRHIALLTGGYIAQAV